MNIIRAVTGLGSQHSKFKQICTPQQRWKKHLNIVKGNPEHQSKLNLKKPYLLFGLQKNCTVNQLQQNIQTLVLSCNRVIPGQTQKIKNLQRYTQADGFIYFYISDMESFGC